MTEDTNPPGTMHDEVRAETVNITQGGAAQVTAGTVTIKQGGAQNVSSALTDITQGGVLIIESEHTTLNASGAAAVVTEHATIDHSRIGILMANTVNARDSKIGVVLGGDVEGRPDVAFGGRFTASIGATRSVNVILQAWFAEPTQPGFASRERQDDAAPVSGPSLWLAGRGPAMAPTPPP